MVAKALDGLSRFRHSIPRLSLMRILSLLGLYRLNSRPDTALKLIALSLNIGAVNGLETDGIPLSTLRNTERTNLLHLWVSLNFSQITRYQAPSQVQWVNDFNTFVGPWVEFTFSDEDSNSRLTQMHLYTLETFMSEIHRDQVGMSRLTTALVLIHLQHLDRIRSNLPLYFCFEAVGTSDMLNGLDDRQKASIVSPLPIRLAPLNPTLPVGSAGFTSTLPGVGTTPGVVLVGVPATATNPILGPVGLPGSICNKKLTLYYRELPRYLLPLWIVKAPFGRYCSPSARS